MGTRNPRASQQIWGFILIWSFAPIGGDALTVPLKTGDVPLGYHKPFNILWLYHNLHCCKVPWRTPCWLIWRLRKKMCTRVKIATWRSGIRILFQTLSGSVLHTLLSSFRGKRSTNKKCCDLHVVFTKKDSFVQFGWHYLPTAPGSTYVRSLQSDYSNFS